MFSISLRCAFTRSVDESLRRLNVEYVDLIQCHDIEFVDLKQIVDETLPALHRLKSTGKVRHVGITGLPLKIFPAVIDRAGPELVETILSFCHYALNDDSLESLLPYCQQRGVSVINAAPTGMGLLTTQGPPSWHPASETIRAGCRPAVDLLRQARLEHRRACDSIRRLQSEDRDDARRHGRFAHDRRQHPLCRNTGRPGKDAPRARRALPDSQFQFLSRPA